MSPFNGASSAVKSKTPLIHRYHKYSECSPLSLLLFSNTNYGIHYVYARTYAYMHTGRAVLSQRRTVLSQTLLEPRCSGTRASLVHNTDSTLFKTHPAQFFSGESPAHY